jgi:hypothetical protein
VNRDIVVRLTTRNAWFVYRAAGVVRDEVQLRPVRRAATTGPVRTVADPIAGLAPPQLREGLDENAALRVDGDNLDLEPSTEFVS